MSLEGTIEQTDQANNAIGLLESTTPIVAGRVPCSLPYDEPYLLNACTLSRPFVSAAVGFAMESSLGGDMWLKLTASY